MREQVERDLLLEVEGLSKVYPSGWGLEDVTFSLPRGSIVSLGGPNGSGKSTLLRCIAGLARFHGVIRIDGVAVTGKDGAAIRAKIGYLPQDVVMPATATIGEVVDFFAELRGADPNDLPLPGDFLRDWDDRMGPLSGGQRQRVALAVALLGTPDLLLLDEPVASLDEDARETVWRVLRRLRDEEGTTILIATPSPSDLLGVSDRAIHMLDGFVTGEEAGEPGNPPGGGRDGDEPFLNIAEVPA